MSQVLKLELNIRFNEKITSDDDIKEIVENVLQGLVKQVDEEGISPESSIDTYVEYIEVNEPFSGINKDIHYV
jgi:hypothetical protein